jgi:RNA polymerase sigma-70 factor (ECF subfamily)
MINLIAIGVGVGESPGLETRPSLLMRLRDASDSDAWERFVRIYGRLIYADCLRRGLATTDAEDVTQEIFSRVVRGIRGFEYQPESGRFRDWLGAISRNECRRFFARRMPPASLTSEPTSNGADPEWDDFFAHRILTEAMNKIRPDFAPATWEAFEAVWQRQEAVDAVAARLGLSLASVYLAKSRILKRLDDVVRQLADDWPTLT